MFRLPFRDDKVFSVLAFATFVIPLAFTLNTYEHYEVVKLGLFFILTGWALLEWVRTKYREELNNAGGNNGHKVNRIFAVLLGGFWIWTLFSSLYALDVGNSIFGFYPRFTGGFLFVSLWVVYLLLLLSRLTKEKFVFLLKILLLDAVIIAVVGLLQSAGVGFYNGLNVSLLHAAPSLLGNPNFSSMFAASLLPVGFVFALDAKKRLARWYYIFTVLLIVLSVSVLASRGALLGMIAGLVFCAVILLRAKLPKRYLYAFAGLAVVAGILGFGFLTAFRPQTVGNIFAVNFKDGNVQLRFFAWEVAIKAVAQHPLLGTGPGNLQVFFESHREKALAVQTGVFDDAHNLFLQQAATGGIPAAILFVALLATAVVLGLRKFRQERDLLQLAVIGGLASVVVMACFNPVVIPIYLILAIFLAGLAYGTGKEYLAWRLPRPARVVLALLGIVGMVWGTAFIVAEHLFFQGDMAYTFGQYQKADTYLKWALRLNRTNQLYYVYSAANAIKLHQSETEIIRQIQDIARLNPTSAATYKRTANLYFLLFLQTSKQPYFDKTISEMSRSFAIDPYNSSRYGRLGYYFLVHNELLVARDIFKEGLTLDPSNTTDWLLLAKVYQLQGKRPQLEFAINHALEVSPDDRDIAYLHYLVEQPAVDIRYLPIYAPAIQENIE